MKLTSDIFNEEYDLTITNPPFGKECLFSSSILNNKEDLDLIAAHSKNNKVPKKIASELFIVANGINNSKISTFLCPESMLANNNFHAFRKKALLSFTKLPMGNLEKAEKLENLRFLANGMKVKMIVTQERSIGIDTPEDLEKARLKYNS